MLLEEVGESAAVIKIVTWIKLLSAKFGYSIEGKAAVLLVTLVSIGWGIANASLAGQSIDIQSAVTQAIKAIIGYGLANLGLFGQPGKDFISKPIL